MTQAEIRSGEEELDLLDRYWRAANYVSVGQIYLMDNPLLREPLRPEHVKPRLLGHWGTTPGLNFIYAHLTPMVRAAWTTSSASQPMAIATGLMPPPTAAVSSWARRFAPPCTQTGRS